MDLLRQAAIRLRRLISIRGELGLVSRGDSTLRLRYMSRSENQVESDHHDGRRLDETVNREIEVATEYALLPIHNLGARSSMEEHWLDTSTTQVRILPCPFVM